MRYPESWNPVSIILPMQRNVSAIEHNYRPNLLRGDILFGIECKKREVEHKRNPIAVDKEEEGQEAVDRSFRDDVCVETIAEVDGVNVVAVITFTLATVRLLRVHACV